MQVAEDLSHDNSISPFVLKPFARQYKGDEHDEHNHQ